MAEFRKKNNSCIIVSREGRLVAIPADQILSTTNAILHMQMSYLQTALESDIFIEINKRCVYGV